MINKEDIVNKECRFAVLCKNPNGVDDLHLVKEQIHLKDGTIVPNVRLVENYQRKFWITRKGAQNHKEKKEWESLDNLIEFKTNQTRLVENISKAIGMPWFNGTLRKLCRNPYIYGADILSTAVIKRDYQVKYPDAFSYYSVAVFDVETDMIHGTEAVLMATISFKDKVYTAIQKSFVEGESDVLNRLQQKLDLYIGEHVKARNIKWEVELVDSPAKCIIGCINKAHEWKPDFLSIWNMDFDIPKAVAMLEKEGYDPKDVFSDPSVPEVYRHFSYKQGNKQKVTASGKVTPIKPAAQWHTVYCPSSFYIIDSMCSYKHIRIGTAEEPSYALDAILQKHLGIRKLKFKEADQYEKADWHIFMQDNFPLEYIIYNVFDCVSVEMLDEKTNDLMLTLPLFSGCSDFENFKSQPRRLVDNLHYFCLENEAKVIATTSDAMVEELDKYVTSGDGWIVTLPAHLIVENGLNIISEDSNLRTNIRAMVADLDVSAAYPNNGSVFNISKETTHKEIVRIAGIPESLMRSMSINLSGAPTNSVEIMTTLFGVPTMDEFLEAFNEEERVIM